MYNLKKDKDNYFLLGKIIKTYSYRGEMVIHLDTDKPEDYNSLEVLFMNIEDSLVPWFISNIDIRDDLATVKLDDIDELEKAREFVGCEIYLPIEQLSALEGKEFYFHEVIGYQAVDEQRGDIGKVVEIIDRYEQEIIRIMKGEKEILVPLSEEMISKIDRKNKTLYLNTPPGLIELYLG
jgi:16S rRNA processing protein RimM